MARARVTLQSRTVLGIKHGLSVYTGSVSRCTEMIPGIQDGLSVYAGPVSRCTEMILGYTARSLAGLDAPRDHPSCISAGPPVSADDGAESISRASAVTLAQPVTFANLHT